jgi:hypothetical protein
MEKGKLIKEMASRHAGAFAFELLKKVLPNIEKVTKISNQTDDGMNQRIYSSIRDNYQIKTGDNNTNFFGGTHKHDK